jgi:hypothetical protein
MKILSDFNTKVDTQDIFLHHRFGTGVHKKSLVTVEKCTKWPATSQDTDAVLYISYSLFCNIYTMWPNAISDAPQNVSPKLHASFQFVNRTGVVVLRGVRLSPLGTAATIGLLYQPQMIVEQLVEWRLAEETEVLGENLPERNFIHHKSHMTRPGLEPGPPLWEASD